MRHESMHEARTPWGTAGAHTGRVRGRRALAAVAALAVELSMATSWGQGWQNPTNRFDVNADGAVTPLDALLVINAINASGPAPLVEPPPAPPPPPPFLDVNGDSQATPIDALQVINFVNSSTAAGDVGIRTEARDSNGDPIDEVPADEEFYVVTHVEDLRAASAAQGVFSAYLDITYESAYMSPSGGATYGPEFPNVQLGDFLTTPGLIEGIGATSDEIPGGPGEFPLFAIGFIGLAPGPLNIQVQPSSVLATLVYGYDDPVDAGALFFRFGPGVAAIPEPGSACLALAGVVAVILARRRQRLSAIP